MVCEDFVWPDGFARGWTDALRLSYLYDLLRVIAALTALEAQHVNRLDVPSWARFLQVLEDSGPAWMVAVLYGPATQNITMRVALKCHIKILLRSNDPGGTAPVSGVLDALARETVKCWKCCMLGHFARDCPRSSVRARSGVRVSTCLACRGRLKSTTH
jgi:hypothetical protein